MALGRQLEHWPSAGLSAFSLVPRAPARPPAVGVERPDAFTGLPWAPEVGV